MDYRRYCLWGLILNTPPLYMVYPLRLAKTIQQSGSNMSMVCLLASIIQREGITGVYKGFSVFTSGMLLTRLFQFGSYDAIRDLAQSFGFSNGIKLKVTTAAVSGVTMASILTPFDVIAQRRSVNRSLTTNDIVMLLIREDGVRSLFRGYSITVCAVVPYTVCFFGVYDVCNYILTKDKSKPFPLWQCTVSGGIAGGISAVVSVPLDVIKTRIQLASPKENLNVAVTRLRVTEGWKGFFKGTLARVLIMAPMAAINFVIFDVVKRWSTINI